MTNNRKMIDANQCWVLYITWVITKNCSTSQDCVGKIVNFCKLIPKPENVTGKLFFCSVFLKTTEMTQYHKQSLPWNPRACSFEDFCYSVWSQYSKTILTKSGHKFPSSYKHSHTWKCTFPFNNEAPLNTTQWNLFSEFHGMETYQLITNLLKASTIFSLPLKQRSQVWIPLKGWNFFVCCFAKWTVIQTFVIRVFKLNKNVTWIHTFYLDGVNNILH